MRAILATAVLVAALCQSALGSAASPAGQPVNLTQPEDFARAGQCMYGRLEYVGNYTNVVRTSTGAISEANRPLLLPFGSLINLTCDADTVACFAADAGATITSTVGVLTDAGSTSGVTVGIGGCFKVEASSYRDQAVWRSTTSPSGTYAEHKQLSTRTKSCGSTVAAKDKALEGFPCDAASDCLYSATTCAESNGPVAGSFLLLRAPVATACWVCVER